MAVRVCADLLVWPTRDGDERGRGKLTPDGRFLTLLCTYADVLAQQRSFVRSMRNPLPESLMVLKSMRTYGTRALRLTTDPPPGWTEVMLLTEHQEPVGRRSFQR